MSFRVEGDMRIAPLARATRRVSGLSPTFTIWACPELSKWLNFLERFILPPSSGTQIGVKTTRPGTQPGERYHIIHENPRPLPESRFTGSASTGADPAGAGRYVRRAAVAQPRAQDRLAGDAGNSPARTEFSRRSGAHRVRERDRTAHCGCEPRGASGLRILHGARQYHQRFCDARGIRGGAYRPVARCADGIGACRRACSPVGPRAPPPPRPPPGETGANVDVYT